MLRLLNLLALVVVLLAGCGSSGPVVSDSVAAAEQANSEDYVIGPGDGLQVFVWGHDDLSTQVQVRPDGQISTPLVEDLQAALELLVDPSPRVTWLRIIAFSSHLLDGKP